MTVQVLLKQILIVAGVVSVTLQSYPVIAVSIGIDTLVQTGNSLTVGDKQFLNFAVVTENFPISRDIIYRPRESFDVSVTGVTAGQVGGLQFGGNPSGNNQPFIFVENASGTRRAEQGLSISYDVRTTSPNFLITDLRQAFNNSLTGTNPVGSGQVKSTAFGPNGTFLGEASNFVFPAGSPVKDAESKVTLSSNVTSLHIEHIFSLGVNGGGLDPRGNPIINNLTIPSFEVTFSQISGSLSQFAQAPEPSRLLLLGTGLSALVLFRRRLRLP